MADESTVIIRPDILESKIRAGIPNCDHIQITDMSDGCGSKYEITVVSSSFMGKAIVQQHRMVHKAIDQERTHIHAITLKTKTPESFTSENEDAAAGIEA